MRRFIVEYDILRGEEIVFHGKHLILAVDEADAQDRIRGGMPFYVHIPEDLIITSVVEWQVEA